MTTATSEARVGALPYIKIDSGAGEPYLEGTWCQACEAVSIGAPRACSKCGERRQLSVRHLGTTGRVRTYTVTYRSFPDVQTPFISAIVELDGGGVVRGTLTGVEPEPSPELFDLPVRLEFAEFHGADGTTLVTYKILPRAIKGTRA